MQFDPENTVFLIDGSSFLYRAYYSLSPLHTSSGKQVQAVYCFIRMIKKLVDSLAMKYVVIAWDSKGKTERHSIFPSYKATRQAAPDDLFAQKELIQEFVTLVGIRAIAKEGVEADDLMYSLALDFASQGNTVVLISSDKDMYQLLNDHIVLYDAMKDIFITNKTFQETKGYGVDRVPLFYALVGDSSDNIPGVAGIGKVGAAELVKQFATLDELYAQIDSLKPRLKNALMANKENAYLSLRLFMLNYLPLSIQKNECAFTADQFKYALPLYQKLEFKTLIKHFAAVDSAKKDSFEQQSLFGQSASSLVDDLEQFWATKKLILITEVVQLAQLGEAIKKAGVCAVDTETDGAYPLTCLLVGISFSVDGDTAYYIPCNHKTDQNQLSQAIVLEYLKPLLEDPSIAKYMHNAKYDLLVFKGQQVEVKGLVYDTMIVAKLVNPEWQKVGLKELSKKYFNETMLSFAQVVTQKGYKDFTAVPLALATHYAAADARQTFKLVALLIPLLQEKKLITYYQTIEHPLIEVLTDMESAGVFFDLQKLARVGLQVEQILQLVEKQILQFCPQPINLNSPRQVEQLLFVQLGLPPQKKSSKGTGYSTDYSVLQALAPLHPVAQLLLQYRELAKLKSGYIDALPTYVNSKTGRIHTSFSQIAVATGRLASSDPNLQNVPVSGLGLEIRASCVPSKGDLFIAADYSQIELRVLAYLSQDPTLLNAFAQQQDIHTITAAGIFAIPEHQVTSEQRQVGKKINFSVLYGQGAYSLARELHIPFKQAQQYIDGYFAHYSRVKEWMGNIVGMAKKDTYVSTHFGRRRYIEHINAQNGSLRQEAYRIAVNTVVQGTAADIVKIAMIRLFTQLRATHMKGRMVLQIHDEIIVTVAVEHNEEVLVSMKEILETVCPTWNVPLTTSIRSGYSWKEISK